MSPLLTLCDSIWHVSFRSGEACVGTVIIRLIVDREGLDHRGSGRWGFEFY